MWISSTLVIVLLLATLVPASVQQGQDNGTTILDELKEDETIEETIRTVLLQLRNKTDLNIPGMEIPDPMPTPDFSTQVREGYTKVDVKLWNSTLTGLSSFFVEEVTADLENMNTTIGMNLSSLITRGQYKINGTYTILRVTGEGQYWMKLIGAYVSGNMRLRVNEDNALEVAAIKMDCNVADIQLNFENLFGNRSGAMSTVSNTILNIVSNLLFENVKPNILDEMETTITNALNEQFQTLPRQPTLSRTKSPLDLAIANTATQIREKNYDPYSAPDFQQSFNRRFLVFRLAGNISLYNGYIKGLSSIHRTGPIKMSYKKNSLNAIAELGFDTLEGGYKWDATFMKISRKGGIHFLVKGLSLMASVTQINEKNHHPKIQELKITKLTRLAMDMDGLGSFDYLLEFFTNFFTNAFKKQFARITETVLKRELQENLNKVQLPF